MALKDEGRLGTGKDTWRIMGMSLEGMSNIRLGTRR